MGKKTKTSREPRFDSDRIQGIAFWFWEYQRRNPAYRRFSFIIEVYRHYFDELGELEFIESVEGVNQFVSDAYEMDDPNPMNYPYAIHLGEKYGIQTRRCFCKLSFLIEAVRRRFHRVYRPCFVGIDSNEALSSSIQSKQQPFKSCDHSDINALLRSYYKWAMRIDDDIPNHYMSDLDKTSGIHLNHEQALNNPEQVMHELHAVRIFNTTFESIFSKQRISDETLEAVYKLCLAGKHIVSSDTTRIIILWMWDKAHEADEDNPLDFDSVHQLLKDYLSTRKIGNDRIATLLANKKRLSNYYKQLCLKIKTMNPLCTAQNEKQLPSIKDVLSL